MSRRRLAVIGHPVGHSRSPAMQNAALAALGLDGEWGYGAIDVAPENFEAEVRELPGEGFAGANVTVPHKEAALALADAPSDVAREIGAANTLVFSAGMIGAHNTDADGFLRALPSSPSGARALVLGAGGAARAIVWALLTRKFEPVHVVNRGADRAAALAEKFGRGRVLPATWSELPRLLRDARFLVNTTTLGMAGQPPLNIDLSPLSRDAVVNDIVYVPLTTDLMRWARGKGMRTAGGLGMLLHQAVPGFERWFGQRPAVTPELRAVVEASIKAE